MGHRELRVQTQEWRNAWEGKMEHEMGTGLKGDIGMIADIVALNSVYGYGIRYPKSTPKWY